LTPGIAEGAPEAWRHEIAALYLGAFEGKVGPVFGRGDTGVAMLATCLDLTRCLVATAGGRLAGVAGFCLDRRRLVRAPGWRDLVGLHGPVRAGLALLLHGLLRRRETPDTLLMDGIAVAPALRGQGIGGCLLRAVRALAGRHGRGWVRLDVVDTNPAARRLYLRAGFVPVAEQRLGALGQRLFGFSAATTMRVAAIDP
jgi:ribosomal protein S18 acetylase RimI-like enzyme